MNHPHATVTSERIVHHPQVVVTPERVVNNPHTTATTEVMANRSHTTTTPGEMANHPHTITMPGSCPLSQIPSRAPEAVAVEVATTTCLYVPVEGDIKVLPWSSSTSIGDILEWRDYEGLAFSSRRLLNQGYLLSGFIRTSGPQADAVNTRCTKLYIAEINGPVIIVNEDRDGDVVSLTEKDIRQIFK